MIEELYYYNTQKIVFLRTKFDLKILNIKNI